MKANSVLRAMSKSWVVTVGMVSVFISGSRLLAQDAATPQEPEYVNSFFLLDSGAGIKPLERQAVGVGAKSKLLGIGGMGVSYEIQNEHSPIRIEADAPLEIIVKLENHDVDPASMVLLYPLKIVKGKRQLLISGVGFMATHTKSDLQSKQLQLTFAKYGKGSLKITPVNPLAPGEYAIAVQTRDQQPTAYCFGIDAHTK